MRAARRRLLKRSLTLSALWAAHASGQSSIADWQSQRTPEAVSADSIAAESIEQTTAVGYLAPYQRGLDRSGVALLDQDGFLLSELALPGRAHGVTADPAHRWGCVFARRPGDFFVVIDLMSQQIVRKVTAPAGRHFYGHGAFSSDGAHLFATENDYQAQQGIIGIYAVAKRYQRIGEFQSRGIGPHDVVRLPGSESLLVANGGIATHPDTGRDKLNLDTMQPSVSWIETRTGRSLGDFELPESLHQVSLRHLACDATGVCWIAGQHESTGASSTVRANSLPLLARLDLKQPAPRLEIVELPESVVTSLQGYISSIAANGNTIMLTSARGGLALSINAVSGSPVGSIALSDCSGVAEAHESDAFIITSGGGEWVYADDHTQSPLGVSANQWDNHLGRI